VVDGENATFKVLRLKLKYVGDRRERRPVLSGNRACQFSWTPHLHQEDGDPVGALRAGRSRSCPTPKGVMTGARARQLGVGGEILCKVW